MHRAQIWLCRKKVKCQARVIIWTYSDDLETTMLCNKIQPWSFLGSGEEDFKCFSPYMGTAALLFNDAERFEQIDSTPLTEGRMWYFFREEDV